MHVAEGALTSAPLENVLMGLGWYRLCKTLYIGVGVGWQRRCKTCQPLRELDNQGTVFCFCFFGSHHDGYRVR